MISSVIRQKDEYQNGCFKKIKHAKFSKKRTFLTPWYARAYWNVPFSENLACFVFLKHPGWFYHIAQSSLIVLSIHFLKCVQIRTRNNSVFGHISRSEYWVISGPYFPVFELNAEIYGVNPGKYGSEITPP